MEWTFLQPLSEEERREVLRLARRRRFRKGEILFHEGDPGDTLHLIDRGHVAMRVTTPLGDVATLIVEGPGGYFGELALISEKGTRNSTVVALDAVETLGLHRDQFEELRRKYESFDRMMVAALADEVRRLSARLAEALYVAVETRVYRRLVDLAAAFSSGDELAPIPLTQDDVASLAGTTRPSANKVLRAAHEDGVLRLGRGSIEVLDLALLTKRAR
jgi:CRP/FNR family transcriptional regulator, cyclic AMP receptor protein